MRQARRWILAAAALAAGSAAAFPYQVCLTDGDGTPLAGETNVTFTLYRTPTGMADGKVLETNKVSFAEGTGLISLRVGEEGSALTNLCDFLRASGTNTIYLGVRVGDGEIRPRHRLLPVPRATIAAEALAPTDAFAIGGKLTASNVRVGEVMEVIGQRSEFGSVTAGNSVLVSGNLDVKGQQTVPGGVSVASNMTVAASLAGGRSFKVGELLQANAAEIAESLTVGGVNPFFPKGTIVPWLGDGNNVPEGWAICDGRNVAGYGKTPDLIDRFPLGAGGNVDLGVTGGTNSVVLTVSQIPNHTHTPTRMLWMGYNYSMDNSDYVLTVGSGKDWKTSAAGEGKAHENRPSYRQVVFIIKTF